MAWREGCSQVSKVGSRDGLVERAPVVWKQQDDSPRGAVRANFRAFNSLGERIAEFMRDHMENWSIFAVSVLRRHCDVLQRHSSVDPGVEEPKDAPPFELA